MRDIIKGDKVIIRPVTLNDIALLVLWWNDGSIMKHVGYLKGLNISSVEVEKMVKEEIEDVSENRSSRIYIILDTENNKPIGEISYSNLDLRNDNCSFGIKICDLSYQGRGYGKEAVTIFISYLFNKFNLHRIELETLAENIRAQALYEKVGFTATGIKRDSWKDPFNNYRSAIIMDVIKDEWLNFHKI